MNSDHLPPTIIILYETTTTCQQRTLFWVPKDGHFTLVWLCKYKLYKNINYKQFFADFDVFYSSK